MNDIQLYYGDCLEVMKTLPDGSVDAVITDPPYGIGFKYSKYKDISEGYGEWLWAVLSLAESKCVPGSPIFVWQAMLNIRRFAEWFPREWRIFAACKNWIQMRSTVMQYAYDPVVVWWLPGAKPYSARTLSRDFFVADTTPQSHKGLNDVQGHPCPRPLDLMLHVVNQWVKPGGIVLDSLMGSGTTGVACVLTDRRFIGIEIDKDYFNIAKQRIEEAQRIEMEQTI